MKITNVLLVFSLIILTISCSNPNKEFIDKLKEQKANNELGLDLKYKVIKLEVLDTLYNQELADSLQLTLNNNLNDFKQLDMNKEDFIKFKNQELVFRDDKNYYKNVVFNDEYSSEWLRELKVILERTDKLLSNYDSTNILDKAELYTWYSRRYWDFNENTKYKNSFNNYYEEIIELKGLEKEISTLKEAPNKIVHYKTKVNFEQVNPLLNNAKQNLTEVKLFDESKNLIE